MQRYNSFNLIHKGLRAMLYDTALAIQHTDFTNPAETLPTLEKVENTLYFFDEHADHEDRFILPAIEKHNKKLVDNFEKEHVTDHRLAADLRNLKQVLNSTLDPESRYAIGRQIFFLFNAFVAFNLEHMNREEDQLNKVLWEHYTDEEILTIEQNIVNSISPDELFEESKWMMRGINNAEVISWLRGVKMEAPEFIFQSILQLARQELPETRWNEISKKITLQKN
ncbi:hemerythrin domain-containing protein [Rhodocytophaga aerolata]|uniref:Hemerythrin domain-containing protein n=1 Tax=Rhodocytophaga aerolata TaxID=455078 RepID=A0ABT8RE60_9BACT|nr:hemerythrin domain-containing protein [Rhodocytophaga aerolata]MDO1450259.1 hemerythrin domain-containing protein [Rhodocytophaga aerolata]